MSMALYSFQSQGKINSIFTNFYVRRFNPGINPITASVRSTYGNAHQVVFPSMCCTDTSAQVGMNSNLPQFQERRKFLGKGVGMKQEESALKEGWTSSWRTSVGAAGDLKVVDSFKCPH